MTRMTTRAGICGALLALFLSASHLYANGYRLLCVKSTKATAMGEAFIVQADDPSAVAYNPAGIAQLKGLQLSLQGTLCNASTFSQFVQSTLNSSLSLDVGR